MSGLDERALLSGNIDAALAATDDAPVAGVPGEAV
jgi:hypothetical protein